MRKTIRFDDKPAKIQAAWEKGFQRGWLRKDLRAAKQELRRMPKSWQREVWRYIKSERNKRKEMS